MSYHYNVYLLCYSRHVGYSSHVQSILAIVRPILVCQDIVAGQQRILIISSVCGCCINCYSNISLVHRGGKTTFNISAHWITGGTARIAGYDLATEG